MTDSTDFSDSHTHTDRLLHTASCFYKKPPHLEQNSIGQAADNTADLAQTPASFGLMLHLLFPQVHLQKTSLTSQVYYPPSDVYSLLIVGHLPASLEKILPSGHHLTDP